MPDIEWMTADRALVAALARGDADAAAALLDDDFLWVDCDGGMHDRAQALRVLPAPPLGDEAGLAATIHRYGEVATIQVERDKVFVLRIWVTRAGGARLLVYHEVSQKLPPAPHGPGRKDWDNPCYTLPYEPRDGDERACLAPGSVSKSR
jgi:hypothetical protein